MSGTVKDLVQGLARKVMRQKGRGYSEKVYQNALCAELNHAGVTANAEVHYPIRYTIQDQKQREVLVGHHHIDIELPDSECFVEVKAIQRLGAKEHDQASVYAREHNRKTFLVNFCQDHRALSDEKCVEIVSFDPPPLEIN